MLFDLTILIQYLIVFSDGCFIFCLIWSFMRSVKYFCGNCSSFCMVCMLFGLIVNILRNFWMCTRSRPASYGSPSDTSWYPVSSW